MDLHQPEAVGDSVYRRIRTDIIFGRLPPGKKLRLEQLKKDYEASISTLREILNRLSSEGLVVAEGQKGFVVAPVSPENLREIAALRELLECYALDQSFAAGDLNWEAHVLGAHHKLAQMEAKMLAGDRSVTEQWKRFDWEFHQALISACGSRVLMDTHAVIFDKYLRYQMISLTFRGAIAADEHRQLLEAAFKRDSKTAQEILRRHVQGGVEHGLTA